MKTQNSSEKGKNIYERLLNIMTSITPAVCFCIYIWIVGYNSREFILGSGMMFFYHFFLESLNQFQIEMKACQLTICENG